MSRHLVADIPTTCRPDTRQTPYVYIGCRVVCRPDVVSSVKANCE
jgi:hypothetical protein